MTELLLAVGVMFVFMLVVIIKQKGTAGEFFSMAGKYLLYVVGILAAVAIIGGILSAL